MNADIALIHLKTDIVFNGTIIFACLFNYKFNFLINCQFIDYTSPVCLPNSVDTDPVSGIVTLTGWGTIDSLYRQINF
jgi:hypothetical protein